MRSCLGRRFAGQDVSPLFFDDATPESVRKWIVERPTKLSADQLVTHGKGFYWAELDGGMSYPPDDACALECFRAAAALGSIEARHYLSVCYEFGKGVAMNKEEAFRWCSDAAEQKTSGTNKAESLQRARALRRLGRLHWLGIGVTADQESGRSKYESARTDADSRLTRMIDTDLVVYQFDAGDFEKAVPALMSIVGWNDSRLRSNAVALYCLGTCFLKGQGVEKDESAAFECFIQGTKDTWYPFDLWESFIQCSIRCQYEVGRCQLEGIGTAVDVEDGKVWLRKAADNGLEEAKHRLSQC